MVQNNLLEKIIIELAKVKQENIELKNENIELKNENTELKNENIELKSEIKRPNEIVNKDSSNSSKPSSTNDGFKEPKKISNNSKSKTKKKKGGQIGSKGTNLKKVTNPDHIEKLEINSCKNCNHNLEDITSTLTASKQLFDIPKVKIEVTQYEQHTKTCPCCNTVNKPKFPEHLKSYVQYGDNIKTLVAYLNTYQMLPYDRISEFLEDFVSHKISNGTIYNMLNSFSKQLESFENDVKEHLLKSEVLNIDETGTRVKDKLHWTHVVSNDLLTYYMIHEKRGKEAIDAMAILPTYKGIAVHS
jgi:transposase